MIDKTWGVLWYYICYGSMDTALVVVLKKLVLASRLSNFVNFRLHWLLIKILLCTLCRCADLCSLLLTDPWNSALRHSITFDSRLDGWVDVCLLSRTDMFIRREVSLFSARRGIQRCKWLFDRWPDNFRVHWLFDVNGLMLNLESPIVFRRLFRDIVDWRSWWNLRWLFNCWLFVWLIFLDNFDGFRQVKGELAWYFKRVLSFNDLWQTMTRLLRLDICLNFRHLHCLLLFLGVSGELHLL